MTISSFDNWPRPLPRPACHRFATPRSPCFRKTHHSQFHPHRPLASKLPAGARTCFEGPIGEVIRATGPMARVNPFRFSTKYQDDETDLLYYGYRYYNPSTGRWLSTDPIAERGGVSLYVLLGNAPIDKIDALGEKCVNPCAQFNRPEGIAGAVICCEGDMYLCVWGPFPGITDAKASAIVEKCLLNHEDVHAYDVKACDKCRKDIYRPDWKRRHIQPSSECRAWTEEYNCLISSIKDCGTDKSCRLQIMNWVNELYRGFRKGAHPGCPVPPAPPWW